MSKDDSLYDHIAHLDCLPRPEEPDETVREMHLRIQGEQQSAYAAKANRENVKLLIAAMEPLKP